MQGLIRALGLQKMASFIALALFWLLGIPLAALFAFSFDWGVLGMNSGLAVATIGQGFAFFTIVYRQDWYKIAKEAIERMKKEELELQMVKVPTAEDIAE